MASEGNHVVFGSHFWDGFEREPKGKPKSMFGMLWMVLDGNQKEHPNPCLGVQPETRHTHTPFTGWPLRLGHQTMVWTALKAFPCLVDFLAFDATLLLHHAPVPRRGASVNGLRALGAPSGHSLLARCSVLFSFRKYKCPFFVVHL